MALYHVLSEKLPMDVLGREPTGPPNDDLAIVLTPFQN
jgi:hypothetical protein